VEALLGDARKAHQRLGWRPEVGFDEIVREMIEADLQRIEDTQSFRHE
jgi:GDPmannose 4,6-dehydratase